MPYPVAAVRGKNYGGASYANKVLSYSPIAYWPLWEATGAVATDISGNGYHGAYTAVTLGQTGIGDGETCPLFDGTTSFVDVYSTGLRDAFDGIRAKGSLVIWAKVFNVGVWTDGIRRHCMNILKDGNYYVHIRKIDTNNRTEVDRKANTVSTKITKTSMTTTDWICWATSWYELTDEHIAYYNGAQEGATLGTLGAWGAGQPIVSANTNIGSYSTVPDFPWYGWLAHYALFDSILTPEQMADLAAV